MGIPGGLEDLSDCLIPLIARNSVEHRYLFLEQTETMKPQEGFKKST